MIMFVERALTIYLVLGNLFCVWAKENHTEYKVLGNTEAVQAQGEELCQDKLGPQWHLADGQSNQETLYSIMKKHGITSAWLAPTKHDYPDWRWLNENILKNSELLNQFSPDELCGGVSLQHKENPKAMSCDGLGAPSAFCCQFGENRWCDLAEYQSNCKKVGVHWFLLECKAGVTSWQQARSRCLQAGGDLAVLDTKATFQAVHDLLRVIEKTDSIDCRAFIGLRKQEWRIARNDPDIPVQISDIQQDLSVKSPCVYINTGIRQDVWKAAACDNRLPIICQKRSELIRPGGLSPTRNCTGGISHGCIVGSVSIFAILLVVGGVVLVFFILWRRGLHQKRETMKRPATEGEDGAEVSLLKQPSAVSETKKTEVAEPSSVSETNLVEEGEPSAVAETNAEIEDEVKKEPDKVTVVIFSCGIKDIDNCIVKNVEREDKEISEEGIKAANFIADEYNNFISIFQSQEKATCTRNLRILNHSKYKDREKLSSAETHSALKYLVEHKTAIDIIYLPGMANPLKPECLSMLKELRDSCVLVTFAKSEISEITASEALAFVIYKQQRPEQITTTVVDFQVTLKEDDVGKPLATLHEVAARAAGFIAGILQYSKNKTQESVGQWLSTRLGKTTHMREFIIDIIDPWKPGLRCKTGFGELKFDEATRKKAIKRLKDFLECSKESIVRCLKPPQKEITIAICSSPLTINENEKNIVFQNSRPQSESLHGNIVKNLVMDILRKAFKSMDKNENIKIIDIPIRNTDIGDDLQRYKDAVVKIRDDLKSGIVYVSGTAKPPDRQGIKNTLLGLPPKHYMVTAAIGPDVDQSRGYCLFPAEYMIATSYAEGPQGSLIEFLSDTPVPNEYRKYDKESNVKAAVAAADAICMTLAVLSKIQELGLEDQVAALGDKTAVMRNILIRLCSDFPQRSPENGFGVLRPWLTFQDDDRINQLIKAQVQEKPRYWLGKNL